MVERQLSKFFQPGDIRFIVVTKAGRVIGAYENIYDACALVHPGQTVYRMEAELWVRGLTRVFLSYSIHTKPKAKVQETQA